MGEFVYDTVIILSFFFDLFSRIDFFLGGEGGIEGGASLLYV